VEAVNKSFDLDLRPLITASKRSLQVGPRCAKI